MPSGLRDGLVFAGGMEFPGSTYYHDASGRENHGTLTNMDPATDWVWSAELGRWVLDFDGSNDYISTLLATGLPSTWSFSCWASCVTGGLHQTFFSQAVSMAGVILYASTTFGSAAGGLRLWANDAEVCVGPDIRNTGNRHVVATYSGGSGDLWVDGLNVSSGSRGYTPQDTTLLIGQVINARYYSGDIADVLLHNRALAPAEIRWLADPTHHLRVPWRRRSWLVGSAAVAPLDLADDTFQVESPFEADDPVGTVLATGGTSPYSYSVVSQALSSGVGMLKVTGTLDPDATGVYVENGTYRGEPAYERDDGEYWIWLFSGTSWVLSVAKDSTTDSWLNNSGSGRTGTYTAFSGSGTATVALYAPFQINSSTGVITIDDDATGLEVGQEWEVVVRVTDAVSATDDATVTVTLTAGATPVTVDCTLGSLSQAAAGRVLAQAASTSTLGALSQQAASNVEVHAAAINSLGAVSQAMDCGASTQADATSTLGALSQSLDAQAIVQASVINTLGSITQAAAGEVESAGAQANLVNSLGALLQQAAGQVVPLATGSIVSTLGALSQTLHADDAVAEGDAVSTLGALSQRFDANDADGPIVSTLGGLGQSLDASVLAQADVAQSLGALSQAIDATAPATANATSTLGSLSQAVAAEATIHWYADTIRLEDSGATEVRHLAVRGTLPGIVPLLAAARNGPGTASLRYTAAGGVQYKAPGSATWGTAVMVPPAAVIANDTWIVRDGDDPDCWLRVQVYADYLPATAQTVDVELDDVFNGTIGQANCAAAEAMAGETITWQITCTAQEAIAGTDHSATALTFWTTQPAAGTIEISDDGSTWVSPTTEGTGLVLGTVAAGGSTTLYCRRTIAAGASAAPTLLSQLHASFTYWGEKYYLDARGRFRVFNTAGYRVHFTTDPADPPAETDAADETATALPYTTTATFGDGTHYVALAVYNGVLASGFAPVGPLGESYLTVEISGGEQLADRPVQPVDVQLAAEAAGVIRVSAGYQEPVAANRATQWALAYTTDGSTPAEDTPDVTATLDSSEYAVLDYALPAQADGTTVKVRVQTRRNDGTVDVPDWVYSASEVVTLAADATGPTVPLAIGAS
jgi:hypothetical protein